RRIAADKRLADEVGNLRDRGKDGDVADQQVEQRVMLLLDHLPLRLRRQQERLDPIGKLAQVICPHVQPSAFRILKRREWGRLDSRCQARQWAADWWGYPQWGYGSLRGARTR